MMMCLLYELAWRLGSRVAEGLRGGWPQSHVVIGLGLDRVSALAME